MVEKSDQIRDRIDAQRDELGENLHEIERRFRNTTDLRGHVERHPWLALGIALGTGMTLGCVLHRRSEPDYGSGQNAWSTDYSSAAYPAPTHSNSGERRLPAFRGQAKKFSDSLDNVFASLLAVASTKMREMLADAIPGFGDEYERTTKQRSASFEQGYRNDTEAPYAGGSNREPGSFMNEGQYGNTGSSNMGATSNVGTPQSTLG